MLTHERRAWAAGYLSLAGVDEAGRGPLAGPVVAAAVHFDRPFLEAEASRALAQIDDSKKLSPAHREKLFALLQITPAAHLAWAAASVNTITRFGILAATHLAMARALKPLIPPVDFALVDGFPVPALPIPHHAIIKGDASSLSIAAASIIAKVTRDRIMSQLDRAYPQYGFAQHKGYATPAHLAALRKYGPCPLHRPTFAPVAQPALF